MRKIIISSILIALISLTLVSAFGVSSPYWRSNPMVAYPGMSKEVALNLQNIANPTGDVIAIMKVTGGNDIASLDKEEYEVKEGSTLDVPLRIKIPNDATIGSRYTVKVDVKTKPSGGTGMVQMATGMVVGFDVLVQEKPVTEETNKTMFYVAVIAVVVVLILIAMALRKRRK